MTKEKPCRYEGMYIVDASLNEAARIAVLDKIKEGIKSRGATVHNVYDQGRRRLAYEIAHATHPKREGYYYLVYFEVVPSAIAKLWNEYKLNEHLLRLITLRTQETEQPTFKPTVDG